MLDWTLFNAVDWTIISVLGLSVLLSLWRGFVREAISLAGWIAAFVVANMFVGQVADLLGQWIANVTGRYVAAFALLLAGTLVVAGLLARLGARAVKATGLTLLDRLLGTAFGTARGLIIVLVVVYLLRQLAPPQNLTWLDQSQLMPHLDMLAQWVQLVFTSYQAG